MLVIGLTGKKRVGKDSVAQVLCRKLNLKQIAFADPLRDMLDTLPINPYYKESKLEIIPWLGVTYTDLLQTLGTDWGRHHVSDHIWVRVANQKKLQAEKDGYSGVIFSDIRYINEAEYVSLHLGGKIYLVDGPRGVIANAHSSEVPLPSRFIEATLYNLGSLEQLEKYLHRLF